MEIGGPECLEATSRAGMDQGRGIVLVRDVRRGQVQNPYFSKHAWAVPDLNSPSDVFLWNVLNCVHRAISVAHERLYSEVWSNYTYQSHECDEGCTLGADSARE